MRLTKRSDHLKLKWRDQYWNLLMAPESLLNQLDRGSLQYSWILSLDDQCLTLSGLASQDPVNMLSGTVESNGQWAGVPNVIGINVYAIDFTGSFTVQLNQSVEKNFYKSNQINRLSPKCFTTEELEVYRARLIKPWDCYVRHHADGSMELVRDEFSVTQIDLAKLSPSSVSNDDQDLETHELFFDCGYLIQSEKR